MQHCFRLSNFVLKLSGIRFRWNFSYVIHYDPAFPYEATLRHVYQDWPGLPAGVKFDPSDAELLNHLAAKCGVGDADPHALIDEFIPTLTEEHGICYSHPKNLPGDDISAFLLDTML